MEIEASFVFVRAPTKADDCAIRQHDFQAEHVIASDAVFQTARPARVGDDVAADGIVRPARRIGWIEQSEFLYSFLKFGSDNAGLNNCDKISCIDLTDALHAFQRNDNAAAQWHAATHVAVARAPGCDGNFMLVGESQDR